jgi:hypothetical protein
MITVTLNFANADEMVAFFGPRMAAVAAGAPIVGAPLPPPAAIPAQPGFPPRRKPGRPPKVRPTEQVVADAVAAPEAPLPAVDEAKIAEAQAEADAAPEPEKVWTEPEVREVMKVFNEKFGLDALRLAIVEATGKSRLSEVPVESYGALVARLRREMEKGAV